MSGERQGEGRCEWVSGEKQRERRGEWRETGRREV